MRAQIEAIRAGGMPVMGHIGLTPQTQAESSGFTVQGKTAAAALALMDDAEALQVECSESNVAVCSVVRREQSGPVSLGWVKHALNDEK